MREDAAVVARQAWQHRAGGGARGEGFVEAEEDQACQEDAAEGGEAVDAAPVRGAQQRGAERGRDDWGDVGDDGDDGEAGLRGAAFEQVAGDGEGEGHAGAGAGALQEACGEQHGDGVGESWRQGRRW